LSELSVSIKAELGKPCYSASSAKLQTCSGIVQNDVKEYMCISKVALGPLPTGPCWQLIELYCGVVVCVLDLLPSTRFVPRRSPTPQALFSLSEQAESERFRGTPTGIKARNCPAGRRHAPGGTRAPQLPPSLASSPPPSAPPSRSRRAQRSLHAAPAPARAPPGRWC
jgi:hypothetical protein